ncbi:unnamed protein product [Ambrosiozyma monospora]|uniref:Unnamed protein product n=1 Tax=Ambrosiozyma monospora TaxID=43982 RepID=A0ACB5TUW2_AMBMO|nr:unnamed protein product [Ambrosiozyma monospora]
MIQNSTKPFITTVDSSSGTTVTEPTERDEERLVLINKKLTIDAVLKKELDEEFGNPDEDSDYVDSDDEMYSENATELLQNLDVASILKPITKPYDIVRRKTFVDIYKSKHLSKLADETIHIIEKEQDNVNQLSKLMDVFLGDDYHNYRSDGLALPLYDHNLDLDAKLKKDILTGKHNGDDPNATNNTTADVSEMDLDKTQEENTTDLGHTGGVVDPEAVEANKAIKDPFFKLPQFKRDFDFGVKKVEDAEESRQLIQIALQRNEEFIRSLTTIRNGFIRAERLKNNIYKWCKEIDETDAASAKSTNGNT